MAKKKVVKKVKTPARSKSKSAGVTYATIEHDFIIIAGGGLVVLFLIVFFLLNF